MISMRLKEERERLGLTQPVFGELAKVSKRTVIDWEKGKTSPNAVQLSALAAAGADVQYILTGVRSALTLSADEQFLLDRFRNCNQSLRQAALRVLLDGEFEPAKTSIHIAGDVGQNINGSASNITIKMGKKKGIKDE